MSNPQTDARTYDNAIIDQINRNGGVAGRKLVPLYYDFKSTDDKQVASQAACTYWTQDHKAFVFLAGSNDQNLWMALGGVR